MENVNQQDICFLAKAKTNLGVEVRVVVVVLLVGTCVGETPCETKGPILMLAIAIGHITLNIPVLV